MRWDECVQAVLDPEAAAQVIGSVRTEWGGARLYISVSIARLVWHDRTSGPTGAAERFAAALVSSVQAAGGSESDARSIVLPLAGTHIVV